MNQKPSYAVSLILIVIALILMCPLTFILIALLTEGPAIFGG